MKRSIQLKAERKTVLEGAAAVKAKAASENRDMTEDEVKALETAVARADELDGEIKAAEAEEKRQMDLVAGLDERLSDARRIPGARSIQPGVTVTADEADKLMTDPKKGFASFRDFLGAVRAAAIGDGFDKRLRGLATDAKGTVLATAGSDEQGGYSFGYGGALVPEAFSPNLLSITAEGDPTAGRTRILPMAAPVVKIPARVDKTHTSSVSGGLRWYRRAETDDVTASRMQFDQVVMQAYSLMGVAYATEEILTDSAISFLALLSDGFAEEYGAQIINEKMNGTGVGEYMGILNSPCLVTVTKETSQAADTIIYDNVIKMRSRCWGYGDAIWLYNQDCLPQLMKLSLTIGTAGFPMWQPSLREGEPDMLLGRPAIATEYCKTVGDVGDLVLGNWSQYLEGQYQPLQTAESIHVRFLNNERAFRFNVRNCGMPWWRLYLTPKNSTNTLSPFVVLQAR